MSLTNLALPESTQASDFALPADLQAGFSRSALELAESVSAFKATIHYSLQDENFQPLRGDSLKTALAELLEAALYLPAMRRAEFFTVLGEALNHAQCRDLCEILNAKHSLTRNTL